MTEQEYIERIRKDCFSGDTEDNHLNADDALCDFLEERGYTAIVAEWKKVDKWYA